MESRIGLTLTSQTASLYSTAELEEYINSIPYCTIDEQVDIFLNGRSDEMKKGINESVTRARIAMRELDKVFERSLNTSGEKNSCDFKNYELYRDNYKKLRLLYGTWQHSYREAFLRDEDNMECLDVEGFYKCLDRAWSNPLPK